jgi:uncharacterized protein with FMN-binding domain
MPRVLLAIGSTIAGLALLLSFKSHNSSAAAVAPEASGSDSASGAQSAAGAQASQGGSGASAQPAGKASSTPAASRTGGAASAAARVFTGAAVNTSYGPMQVRVLIRSGRIIRVAVVQRTNDGPRSQQIDAGAIPELTQETLAAQSARVNAVSGASYTSYGYVKSLQSALDMARA